MKKYFKLEELGTNVKTEFTAGLTTFLAMAYILFVNPQILSASGMDEGALFTATALSAIIGTLIMGVYANYPVALAPGMGINAFFSFTVVLGYGIPWETALTAVLISGVLFLLLSLSGIREAIINAIPSTLKLAVASGIGLFIAFVGLQNAEIIIADEGTMVAIGDFTHGPTALAIFGLIVTALLISLKINGGVFYGMVITAVVGIIFGEIPLPTAIFAGVPSLAPTFGKAFTAFSDIGDLFTWQMLGVILTFLFVDFFDTAGTLVAVAEKAGLMKGNELPRADKALLADSTTTVAGAILGTSTATSFVESATGVGVGGRSGLTSVFTSLFFALALFFSPLLSVVTSSVTAPALIIVGVMMASSLKDIAWDKIEIAIPAFLTIIIMPLAYSIATGIAVGFTFYPVTMVASGRGKEIHPIMWVLSAVFVLFLIFLA
ncbi:NCS2 family permease [Amphibacillus sp. Q70]|uniref:NCS2 family permease n=1 Tax=Amphibacillus sp. Q70 TaxID=3453416 RepID=UPI003F85BFF0